MQKLTTLRNKIFIKHGFAFKGEYFSENGEYILLTPGNFFEKGGFKYQTGKEKYYLGEFPSEYLHSKGDLIVAMTEQAEGLLGSMAFVPSDNLYLHNQRLGLVTSSEGIDNEFIYYLFQSKYIRKQIQLTSTGSKVKHTSPERIYAVKALLPSFKEQQKISKVLSTIDAKITLNNKINTELEAMAKLLYDYWFVQFDFPDAQGRPYKSSGGKMVYNERLKREVPEGWEVGTILNIANLLGGGTPKTKEPSFWHGSIPFFTPADAEDIIFVMNTKQNITIKGLENCSSRLYEKGTIFITARGTVGKVNLASQQMAMNQSCYALQAKESINYEFLYFYTNQLVHFLKVKASGSTFKAIVSNDFKFTNLVIPSKELINSFEGTAKPIFDKILINKNQNQQLSQLRDWLLPMLMNGQVKVK